MAVDLLNNVAFCIKTFLRESSLRALVDSILHYYPKARIYIADDSKLTASKIKLYAEYEAKGINLLLLDHDVGLSAGRNALIEATLEPYLLFLEDDFVFTAETNIIKLEEFLGEHYDVGIVGGACRVGDKLQHYEGMLEFENGVLTYVSQHKDWFVDNMTTQLRWIFVDRVFNFFLARREVFSSVVWDPELKLAEHVAFFLDLKYRTDWKVAYTDVVVVDHVQVADPAYMAYRGRNQEFFDIFRTKYGIQSIQHKTLKPELIHNENLYSRV